MAGFTPHGNFEAIDLPNVSPVPLVVLAGVEDVVELWVTVTRDGWTKLGAVQFGERFQPVEEGWEALAPPGYTFQARIEGGRAAVYRVALKEMV